MFYNTFIIACRNLIKHKAYSSINILGLTCGIACSILILLFVQDELSFDKHHEKADQIYRVVENKNSTFTPAPMAPALLSDFPEIKEAIRIHPMTWRRMLLKYKEKSFYEDRFFFADGNIFKVFSFTMIKGNPSTALQKSHQLVITESMAKKYFGDSDPVGQILTLDIGETKDYEITGVIQDPPHSAHMQFDFLASFETLYKEEAGLSIDSWTNDIHWTYVLLPRGYDPKSITKKLPAFFERHMGKLEEKKAYTLQPLREIYLHSNNRLAYVFIFSGIGIFILLIACVNFMNLSTARSIHRVREIGVRKVVGAHRIHLILQFLGESILMSLVALLLAIGFVELILPSFNQFLNRPLTIPYLEKPGVVMMLLGITLFTGIVAGSYPALYLSSFRPAYVLKGHVEKGSPRHTRLRRTLVIFQFVISSMLLVATAVIQNQVHYLKTKSLGFDQTQVLTMEMLRGNLSAEIVKSQLHAYPGIVNATASHRVPGKPVNSFRAALRNTTQDQGIWMSEIAVDPEFIPTYSIAVLTGRNFSKDLASDSSTCILNETAAKVLGATGTYENLIGTELNVQGQWLTVIGIMKDFNFQSLHNEINPLVFHYFNSKPYLSVKIKSSQIAGALEFIQKTFQKLAPDIPFEYTFLNQDFENMYRAEEQEGELIAAFAAIAIFVACLGLFGLASFMTEQRTKEIGIRKVMGASVKTIVVLLSKDFLFMVITALVIAFPLAHYLMNSWLEHFAYRVTISWKVFVVVGIISLSITLLTVSVRALRAAFGNPVESLRNE